ncbi:aromatase/cyclase [Micromonospora okii]|uniref:Aromatase n=1 Tax=Micromonospora okii TaxID=1182970 RepID=A0A023GUH7_9ACTN|nr:aromatase/cyclase [Micromonospora okii]AFJ52672.1 aromatase [Micromonospora okii]
MSQPPPEHTEHREIVAAPARAVYDLVVDVSRWPLVFPPTVHVEHVERGQSSEVIRIWATANDTVKGWTSRRDLDPQARRVSFRQEVSAPPVATMSGEWIIEPAGDGRCLVRLTHDFRAVGDDPAATAWIHQAVDRNSRSELAALRAAVESPAEGDGRFLAFDDVVHVDGDPADVYDFLNEAGQWDRRLPHVARVELTEDTPGLQVLEMDTRTPDGSTHTTRSVRVCFPHRRIVYKQLRTPALMSVHTGQWMVEPYGDATIVTSTHRVVLIPDAVPEVLGPDASLGDARKYVRTALGRNSTATMHAAKEYAERRRLAVRP